MKQAFGKRSVLLFQIFFTLFICSQSLQAQKYTLRGYVLDASSGEKLLNASIYDSRSQQGTLSNSFGFFSLTLPSDTVDLNFSYGGFSRKNLRFFHEKDTTLSVALDYLALDEVAIIGKSNEREMEKTQMSRIEIPIEQIKQLPALVGEVDVLKAFQYMPGVQSGNEGSASLYVRGGGPDQNLILLDGVPLYSVSHFGGFFSIFDADVLSHAQLYKGGFPARYGERLSSIVDLRMKEGNKEVYKVGGSIGLIAARVSVQGPIQKGKSSFILSARRSYVDLLSRPISKQIIGGDNLANYSFYDLTGKANWVVSPKDRLSLSFYMGEDAVKGKTVYEQDSVDFFYREQNDMGIRWGNRMAALRWNRIWNDQLFSTLTLTNTSYQLKTDAQGEAIFETDSFAINSAYTLDYLSQIRDWGAKIDFDAYPHPSHSLTFGAFFSAHRFEPQTYGNTGIGVQTEAVDPELHYTYESGVYGEDHIRVGSRFSANLGLRLTQYQTQGVHNWNLQARVAARLQLAQNIAWKSSFSQMNQNLHLLANSAIGLPVDVWVPATAKAPAQNSWQLASGISASLLQDRMEVSLEGFYKKMEGLIRFQEGRSFVGLGANGESWQDNVEVNGTGEAYGMELLLQKKRGRTTGWLGYTLSWNWRQFDNLDLGERFPYTYDRRHDVSLVWNHKLSDQVRISGTWVFGTGRALTLTTGGYGRASYGIRDSPGSRPNLVDSRILEQYQSLNIGLRYEIVEYGSGVEVFEKGRNGFRMQAYHRLDLGIHFTKQKKWGRRTWTLGIYNAYNRLNPYLYYFENIYSKRDNLTYISSKAFKKLALFPLIPSISYRFNF